MEAYIAYYFKLIWISQVFQAYDILTILLTVLDVLSKENHDE